LAHRDASVAVKRRIVFSARFIGAKHLRSASHVCFFARATVFVVAPMAAFFLAEPVRALVLNDTFNGAGFTVINTTSANQLLNGIDSNNVFNNIVSIDGGSCSGTLINSTTVLTAAHCFFNSGSNGTVNGSFSPVTTVGFTPAGKATASTTVTPVLTIINPNYNQVGSSAADIALLILPTPITTITPVTLSGNVPANGTPILIAGYGLNGTGSNPPPSNQINTSDNMRRIGQTTLGGFQPANDVPGVSGTQNVLSAQFRDPNSPGKYNFFPGSATVALTTAEAGNAPADSGGPVFYCPLGGNVGCAPSQLVQIGDLIGGTQPMTGGSGKANGYGEVNSWTPLSLFLPWVNGNGTLAITAQAGTVNWSSGWTGGVAPGTTNTAWLNNATNMTLDVNTTVSALWIGNAQATLSIGAARTLTVSTGLTPDTGTTTINSGTLSVLGTLATPLLSLTGGTLSGSGTIATAGGNVANYSGTVAPGTPTATGTLTIQGNYLQSPGTGTLLIKIGGGSADQLSVTGAATIGGTLQLMLVPQTSLIGTNATYTILTANTLSGQFSTTPQQLSAFFQASATYTATAVTVSVGRDSTYAGVANTPNAKNFATALDTGLKRGGFSTGMENVYALLDDATVGQADNFFAQADADGGPTDVLGNQLLANLATARMIESTLDQHLASLRDGTASLVQNAAGIGEFNFGYASGSGLAFATTPSSADPAPFPVAARNDQGLGALSANAMAPRPYAFWMHALGGWQTLKYDGNAFGLNQNTTGIIGGIDVDLDTGPVRGLKAGIAFSYTSSTLGNVASESGNADTFRISAYGTRTFGAAYVDGSLTYGSVQMATSRVINDLGLAGTAAGTTNGDEFAANFNAGYRRMIGQWLIEPSAGLAYVLETRQGFGESGAGVLDVNYNSSSLNTLQASAGIRTRTNVALADGYVISPEFRARYLYDALQTAPTTTATLEGLPDIPFTFAGVQVGRSGALVGGGLTLAKTERLALVGEYNAELRDRESVQTVWGGLRGTW
jgi:subtilase-type serine protease